MPIAAVLVALLWGGDVSAVNLARASRISALRSDDASVRDAAVEQIRMLLAADAARVPLYVELVLLLAGRAETEGRRWVLQARWVLARAREVAADTAAPRRERAMLENAGGVIELHAGDEAAARQAFDRAAELDAAYAPAQLNRGILAAHVRDHVVAIEALTRGLHDPAYAKDVDGALALGLTLAKRGQLRRALKLVRGVAMRSRDPRAELVLAIVLMDHVVPAARDAAWASPTPYEEARRALARAVAGRPTNAALVAAAELRIAELELRLHPPNARAMAERDARALAAESAAEAQRLRAIEAELLREQAGRSSAPDG